MKKQNLIIYELPVLFKILNELKSDLNFEVKDISQNELNKSDANLFDNHLFIGNKKIPNISNQLDFDIVPIKIRKLIEKINIEFLKKNFNQQSEVNLGKYTINLNSRLMALNNINLKLTEKETNIIIYLFESKKPIKIIELQSKVWGYQSELETHTVETHVYRLRKKIQKTFSDNNFIISKKDGYQII